MDIRTFQSDLMMPSNLRRVYVMLAVEGVHLWHSSAGNAQVVIYVEGAESQDDK